MSEPPAQPTLVDGDVVLRPWTDEDADVVGALYDRAGADWFDVPGAARTHKERVAAIARWQEQYAANRSVVNFLVERNGAPAGTVEVRKTGDGLGELSWALDPSHRGRGVAVRALRLLVSYAFDALGLERLEAYVETDNAKALRLASRTGLRREGVLRSKEGGRVRRRDRVLVARLVDDAEPSSHEGFIAMLNAGLPRKRVIAHGLLHDGAGHVLLCELTYKDDWDLPGGVVEPGESPAAGVVREIREELGIDVPTPRLRTVNWLPPWRAWDDACVFVFDLGQARTDLVDSMTLQPTEIRAVHWCDRATVRERAATATARMLEDLRSVPDLPYREAGLAPGVIPQVGQDPPDA